MLYFLDFPKKNNLSELDCSQFIDDYDIIRQFPFPVVINPTTDDDYQKSTVTMHKDGIFVKSIIIHKENVVPLSMFCLLNLESLQIVETPFENGNFALLNDNSYFEYLFRYCTRCFRKSEKTS